MELSPGTVLAKRYEIMRPLGRGGMANVYLVKDASLQGKLWAVKELNIILADDRERLEAIERFNFEARILTSLDHPNLPRVADYFSENDRWYLVMEYIEGITLEEAVAGAGRGDIPLSRIRRWIVQICEVLEYLHGRTPPVIFRDLKPANIMLTPDDNVKLIDFGIARLFLEGKEKDTMIIGTPGYAAPEQYGRSQTGVRSDIYSLGATMYFLLTRKDPGFSPLNFKVPSSINQDLPEMWDALIMRSLLLDPERRFASVREIREILEGRATAMLAGATVPAAVTPQPEVSPASLSFNLKERTQTMSDRIVISNSSGGVLRGSLVSDRPWLYLRPAHFRGNRQEVEVTVDLYGERRSWDYTATVTLRAEDAVVDVPVSVKVKRPWFLASVPRRLVSGLLVGESMIPYAGLPLAMFSYYICDRAERGRQSLFLSLAGFIGLMSSALAWYFKIL